MDPVCDPARIGADALLWDARLGPDARARFEARRLEGAVFVDVERDLSGDASDPARGGRHPLPPLAAWRQTLGRLGVTPGRRVVVYDDASGAKAAARAWWMLRASGHAEAQVLDGGLDAAIAAGWPPASGASAPMEAAPAYPVDAWTWPVVDADEVDRRRRDPEACVLDVRAGARFRGELEPYDPPAGHIAGAVNLPLEANLDGSRFKSADALRAQYEELLAGRAASSLAVSCGSGVTACHTLLALERAGLQGAALYVGSYSEWSRQGRPRGPERAP